MAARTTNKDNNRPHLRWMAVALVLLILFCVWFYFTGIWEDLQYD